jgi:hypothetical protein
MRSAAVLFLMFSAACTFEPGAWFATLSPTLSAGYLPRPDREAGAGWQKLSSDYQVLVSRATLELGEVALLGATGGGGPTRFDPAKPPPGYSLCHNGHCHSSDGRLVPYAEIEAQLSGGQGGGLRAVAALVVDGALDLLAPADRTLACEPSCHLDRTRIVRASTAIRRLVLEGAVRDGRTPPRLAEVPFRWQTTTQATDAGPPVIQPVVPPAMEAEVDIPADRDHPPAVALRLSFELGAALFDGVEFADLTASAGALDLADNRSADDSIHLNLKERGFFKASVSRSDP